MYDTGPNESRATEPLYGIGSRARRRPPRTPGSERPRVARRQHRDVVAEPIRVGQVGDVGLHPAGMSNEYGQTRPTLIPARLLSRPGRRAWSYPHAAAACASRAGAARSIPRPRRPATGSPPVARSERASAGRPGAPDPLICRHRARVNWSQVGAESGTGLSAASRAGPAGHPGLRPPEQPHRSRVRQGPGRRAATTSPRFEPALLSTSRRAAGRRSAAGTSIPRSRGTRRTSSTASGLSRSATVITFSRGQPTESGGGHVPVSRVRQRHHHPAARRGGSPGAMCSSPVSWLLGDRPLDDVVEVHRR